MTYFSKSQTFEGKLSKKGKINKAWKERWFVLDEYEQKMEYYPTKEDAIERQHLCGTIDISLIQRIEIISNIDQKQSSEIELLKKHKTILTKFIMYNEKCKSLQPYSFQLVMSGRTYIFCASNSKIYIAWLNELSRVIYGGVIHEGLLQKLGFRNKSWKQRYFTLNKYKQMKYYIDKTRTDYLGLIDLNLCILIVNGKSYGVNHKYTIEIQTPNRNWIICAPEKQQKYKWEKIIKAMKYEKLNETQINNLMQENLWKNHAKDMMEIQKRTGIITTNNINISRPNTIDYTNSVMSMSVDEQMILAQKQMMMNNVILANHINAMNQTMKTFSNIELDDDGLDQISNLPNDIDENFSNNIIDIDEKINEGTDKIIGNGSGSDLKVQKIFDNWDLDAIGQTDCVLVEANNTIIKGTETNSKQWYNLFSNVITESQVQYHWKIRINNYNKEAVLIIGIMDTCYIDEYVQYNKKQGNDNYFAKSKYGFGIDGYGNLQNNGKNGGKYCNEFKNGDIVSIFFDVKQFVLWYGLNGNEYGVACKVPQSFYKCCVAMYGGEHCVELISCDTYLY